MCQIKNLDEMDCTNYLDKTAERLLFAIRNPATFMSIISKKFKTFSLKNIDL